MAFCTLSLQLGCTQQPCRHTSPHSPGQRCPHFSVFSHRMLQGSLSQGAPQGKLHAPWWLQDHPQGSAHGAQGKLQPLPQRVCSQDTGHLAPQGGQGLPLWQLLLHGWPQDSGLLHLSLQEGWIRVKSAGRCSCCLAELLLLLLASSAAAVLRCCSCCSHASQLFASFLCCSASPAASFVSPLLMLMLPELLPDETLPPAASAVAVPAPCRNFSSCLAPPAPAICRLHTAPKPCHSVPCSASTACTQSCMSRSRFSPMQLPQLPVHACKQPGSSAPHSSLQVLGSNRLAATSLHAQLRRWPQAGNLSCTAAGQV